jgi:hypothetical protein
MIVRQINVPVCLYNFTNYNIGFFVFSDHPEPPTILGAGLVYHFNRTLIVGASFKIKAKIKDATGIKRWHIWDVKDGLSYAFKDRAGVTDLYQTR